MALHGRLTFLFDDKFDYEFEIIMKQLPALSDYEVALEMRSLMKRPDVVERAKQMLQVRPGVVNVFLDGRYLIHDALNQTSCSDAFWVSELLKYGADPNARSNSGDTAVSWACKLCRNNGSAYLQALQSLVQAGGDINFLNDQKPVGEGQTPLILAVNTSRLWSEDKLRPDEDDKRAFDLVDACIGLGADVNATDTSGRTALHWAAMCGNVVVVKRLLDAGADPELKDSKQRGVLDWWTHQRNKATFKLLKERMNPRNFAAKTVKTSTEDGDSEIDSEDEVDQRNELSKYFPNVPKAPGAALAQPPRQGPTTLSEEQDRLVKKLMWWSNTLQWSRETCIEGLERCNWDFNSVKCPP
ncbi:hypothetical protein PV08_10790 [Exophiala spinifera]|uniref:Uncharacterized protein n=1 Tax=Exophiala spinifera TaxID=91928 RepID=A0A0D2AYM8_9EURO|nr:uncharacterized protein PV08_10790 [Exophiala spinifera]KIW11490.1 hypothetical protein PV08_10790 [Exophiala spinifera]